MVQAGVTAAIPLVLGRSVIPVRPNHSSPGRRCFCRSWLNSLCGVLREVPRCYGAWKFYGF